MKILVAEQYLTKKVATRHCNSVSDDWSMEHSESTGKRVNKKERFVSLIDK